MGETWKRIFTRTRPSVDLPPATPSDGVNLVYTVKNMLASYQLVSMLAKATRFKTAIRHVTGTEWRVETPGCPSGTTRFTWTVLAHNDTDYFFCESTVAWSFDRSKQVCLPFGVRRWARRGLVVAVVLSRPVSKKEPMGDVGHTAMLFCDIFNESFNTIKCLHCVELAIRFVSSLF